MRSYEGDDTPAKPAEPAQAAKPEVQEPASAPQAEQPAAGTPSGNGPNADSGDSMRHDGGGWNQDSNMGGSGYNGGGNGNTSSNQPYQSVEHDDNYGPINVKEDG
jgi:hypothetical protein